VFKSPKGTKRPRQIVQIAHLHRMPLVQYWVMQFKLRFQYLNLIEFGFTACLLISGQWPLIDVSKLLLHVYMYFLDCFIPELYAVLLLNFKPL